MSKTLQVDDLRIPTTKELKGEELIAYLMKRFNYTRKQALASVKRASNFKLA
tara:strand:+ start:1904 stop:2059 length:156 start_codon:yes stop_codon:yes gene_type:complete